jgi:UDP-glucose 4-epimerase
MSKIVAITGGGGFIGAHLVKKMNQEGWHVKVIDSMLRGSLSRLSDIENEIEIFETDIRDEESLTKIFIGVDLVIHLAAINGTENFYKYPELVFDVGVIGAISVVNASKKSGILDLIIASSAEVYQTPSIIPTPEDIPLMLPNSDNPRYSYGGSKIASELIAFNYAREHFRKMQVFRPHNIYGPDMGWKHVVPQFIQKIQKGEILNNDRVKLNIQGNGKETRAFCYVDDVVDGILTMYQNGDHRKVYHIGNDHEISMLELADIVGNAMNIKLDIVPGDAAVGGTPRRCPDISRMRNIGYEPRFDIYSGIQKTVDWYKSNQMIKLDNPLS